MTTEHDRVDVEAARYRMAVLEDVGDPVDDLTLSIASMTPTEQDGPDPNPGAPILTVGNFLRQRYPVPVPVPVPAALVTLDVVAAHPTAGHGAGQRPAPVRGGGICAGPAKPVGNVVVRDCMLRSASRPWWAARM